MARSVDYTYNPETGQWTQSTSNSSSSSSSSSGSSSSSSSNSSSGSSSGGNLTNSTSSGSSSTGQVEKEYNEIQMNTLEGTLVFIVTEETIKLKAGDTVALKGLGKHLSGNYYVKDVTRSIGSDGYSHTATLIRTDFGSTLKVRSKNSTSVNQKTVSSPQTSSNTKRTHTVKKGEYLWSIAEYYYGDGSLYTKIVDANSDKITDPNNIRVGLVLIIP